MNIPTHRVELPPEAEPARDFIEAIVALCESQIEELKKQSQSLSEQFRLLQSGFKNQILATPRFRLAPSILKANRLESLRSDEFANKEDNRGTTALERTRSYCAMRSGHPMRARILSALRRPSTAR
jgi:hypothetical protein